MNKITLLFVLFISVTMVRAQTTSFENSEGYINGTFVNGLNGWEDQSDGANYFLISDEKASEGINSLKMIYDSQQPLIFANWNFDEALSTTNDLEISVDVFAPADDNTTLYWKIMANDHYAGYIIVQEGYVFPAVVNDVNPVPVAMADLNVNEFNQIKLKYNYAENSITYFVNGEEFFQDEIWGSSQAIDSYSFEGFLFNDMYMDNFKTNDVLSVGSLKTIPFTHFMKNGMLNLKSATPIQSIEIYDMSGKQVLFNTLNCTFGTIDVTSLESGVYIANLQINNNSYPFKFVR